MSSILPLHSQDLVIQTPADQDGKNSSDSFDIRKARRECSRQTTMVASPVQDEFDEKDKSSLKEKPPLTSSPEPSESQQEEEEDTITKYPLLPSKTTRWDCPPQTIVRHTKMAPGSLYMRTSIPDPPEGWEMHIHIEGKPFYERNRHGAEPSDEEPCPITILTDSDPRDEETLARINQLYGDIQACIIENEIQLPERTALVLDIYPKSHDWYGYGGYYLVDFVNQSIFWVEEVDTGDLGLSKVDAGTFGDQHLKLHLYREFWYHAECYPLKTSFDVDLERDKVLEMLTYWMTDIQTSDYSTSVYSADQCQQFISGIEHTPEGRQHWIVARMAQLISRHHAFNYRGHPSARTSRIQSFEREAEQIKETEEDTNPKSFQDKFRRLWHLFLAILLRISSICLLDAPTTHHLTLEGLYVDKIVYEIKFTQLMRSLVDDWTQTSLLATVLFTANMAFLAIPLEYLSGDSDADRGIVLTSGQQLLRTIMVTCSLASTIFSMASIAIGLINIRKHRNPVSAEEAADFLHACYHRHYGLRPLAIFFAMPYSFLLWSVVTFFPAIALFSWLTPLIPRFILLSLSTFAFVSFLVTVWFFWKRQLDWSVDVEGAEKRTFRMWWADWFWGFEEKQ